jgi:hypothetical protein
MKHGNVKRSLLAIMIFLTAGASSAVADTGNIGVAVKGGTLGYGGEVTVGITSAINARAGYNTFSYDGNTNESDVDYNYGLKLQTIPILLDWHPSENGGFRLSSGIIINNNKVTATGSSQGVYTIGDVNYNSAQIGTLTGTVDFKKTAPYFGIGWGNAVGKDNGISITFDLGVMFQGTPNVSLAASGPIANDPTFQNELSKEIADIQDSTDKIKYYPVLSLGLAYKF